MLTLIQCFLPLSHIVSRPSLMYHMMSDRQKTICYLSRQHLVVTNLH